MTTRRMLAIGIVLAKVSFAQDSSHRVMPRPRDDMRPLSTTVARAAVSLPINNCVLDAVGAMPNGGGYATTASAMLALRRAIALDPAGRHLLLQSDTAKPSFCSAATFLVFLTTLDRLQRENRLLMTKEVLKSLMMRSQPDGTGVWGRWNANGPGTARLFYELGVGHNFTSFDQAEPGDFLKIWWTDDIGSTEKGHSVVYIGRSGRGPIDESVTFWSANVPNGYGFKTVPRSKIKRTLFSRLENPGAITATLTLPPSDVYLADMAKRTCTEGEMFAKVGVGDEPIPGATSIKSDSDRSIREIVNRP